MFFACVSGGGGVDNGLLGISRIFQQPGLAIYTNEAWLFILMTFGLYFFGGIIQLQSDWSLSCDHGLGYASLCENTMNTRQKF